MTRLFYLVLDTHNQTERDSDEQNVSDMNQSLQDVYSPEHVVPDIFVHGPIYSSRVPYGSAEASDF